MRSRHTPFILLAAMCLAALLTPTTSTTAQAEPKARPSTLEHQLTLLVEIAPRGEEESTDLYRSRKKKTYEEVLLRLLKRYKTIDVRDLKGTQKGTSGTLELSMRAKRSPGFIQAVAIGQGRFTIRPMREQDTLWSVFANPLSEEASALPDGVEVVDHARHGLVLQSKDASALHGFISKLVTSDGTLHMVRSSKPGVWETLMLGEPVLDEQAVREVSLGKSAHTGSSFAQLHFSTRGVEQWEAAVEFAEESLVLTLDEEPVSIVHQPGVATHLTSRSEKTRSLTFACHATWVGSQDIEECTELAAARGSAFIPLKVALKDTHATP